MALTVSVTNNEKFDVYRVGYLFAAGETKEVEGVPVSRLNELTQCAYLSTVVVAADSQNEIPPGVDLQVNATTEAEELARQVGIDLFGIRGSGKNGRIVKGDVEKALLGAQTPEFLPEGVSTRDSIEDIQAAEAADAAAIREREAAFKQSFSEQWATVSVSEAGEPDQTLVEAPPDPAAGDVAAQDEHGNLEQGVEQGAE